MQKSQKEVVLGVGGSENKIQQNKPNNLKKEENWTSPFPV